MNAITYPLRNLGNHRLRSALTAVGIGAAMASLLALVGLSRGVDSAVALSMQDRGTDIVAIKKGSVEILTTVLDERLAGQLRAQPGVTNVMSSMGDVVNLDTGQMAYVAAWSEEGGFWTTLPITQGKRPGPGDYASAVLGQTLAETLGKRPGDRIELEGQSFLVSGISKQASVIDDRSIILPLLSLQRLLGREGKVSGFHIRIDHPEKPARLAEMRDRLAAAFPELAFVEAGEMATHTALTNLLRAMAWASSTIALVMAFVIVLNTLLMAVTERTREIGLLSAIGWKPSRILATIVLEGVMVAAAGAVVGVAAGLLSLQLMIHHPAVGGFLQPDVTPVLLLQSVVLVLVVGALGGLYPAWRATHMRPMELLRGE